jgi:hypothetical protein
MVHREHERDEKSEIIEGHQPQKTKLKKRKIYTDKFQLIMRNPYPQKLSQIE